MNTGFLKYKGKSLRETLPSSFNSSLNYFPHDTHMLETAFGHAALAGLLSGSVARTAIAGMPRRLAVRERDPLYDSGSFQKFDVAHHNLYGGMKLVRKHLGCTGLAVPQKFD